MGRKILVTGGAGYVGSVLVPELLKLGHKVIVYDTFWFWNNVREYADYIDKDGAAGEWVWVGDIRDCRSLIECINSYEIDTIIHLACISNDPSSELDYNFTHDVSYNGSISVIEAARKTNINRFIYASSNSVYGNKAEHKVTEDLIPEPITQYSKIKMEIEHYLTWLHKNEDFPCIILRPSTLSGYSPRQRLDLVVNMFVDQALNHGVINVFGGEQYRPALNIKDMVEAYAVALYVPKHCFGKPYNLGNENYTVREIAEKVIEYVPNAQIKLINNDDYRSYRICSDKIEREWDFQHLYTIDDGIEDLIRAFETGMVKSEDRNHNLRVMEKYLEEQIRV